MLIIELKEKEMENTKIYKSTEEGETFISPEDFIDSLSIEQLKKIAKSKGYDLIEWVRDGSLPDPMTKEIK
jgi:hypothetical protein